MDTGTLKIGQKVEVIPISESQKEYYPWGWVDEMDKYIGEILTISGYVNEEYPVIDEEAWGHRGNPECYTVKENDWTWSITSFLVIEE